MAISLKNAETDRLARMDAIARHCGSLPDLDHRSADEILGYDEHGLPR